MCLPALQLPKCAVVRVLRKCVLDPKQRGRVYCMQQSVGGDNAARLKRKEHRLFVVVVVKKMFSLHHSKMNVYTYVLDCLWACICELRCLDPQKRALESLELEVFCKQSICF